MARRGIPIPNPNPIDEKLRFDTVVERANRAAHARSGSAESYEDWMNRVNRPPELKEGEISLDDFGGEPKKKSKKVGSKKKTIERSLKELKEFIEHAKKGREHQWKEAEAKHMVAFYRMAHASVYGVVPQELEDGQTYLTALSAAKRMLKAEFGGNPQKMAEFIRWVWARERKSEKWRRSNGRETRRVGWRLQFVTRHLMTDYRTNLVKTTGKTK